MHSAYHIETRRTDTTDVRGVAAWMRVSVDRVQRWTVKGTRPLIPYMLEGGRKQFNLLRVDSHIRKKCFSPQGGVLSPWPEEHHLEQIEYPEGFRLLWTHEFVRWAQLSKAQVDSRVRRGEFPHFQFGGIRLWDPALILEARLNREINARIPMPEFLCLDPTDSGNKR